MTRAERVGENLNRALHALFAGTERLYLLGEDVADPYGGAFKITKGLSTAYPDRVLTTPLSENAIVGVAGGLALCGDTVLVEVMFGDFLGLAFDQILNFATKSVTMYGTRTPMRLVVRCPVGGGRGYGATHSQSVQKHFIGVPNLALYELSPFHDAADVLGAAIASEQPCLLFEDKVLYTRRMFRDGVVDDRFRFELFGDGDGWARAFAPSAAGPPSLVIAPGGMAHRALAAARTALDEGHNVQVLVPARLYPVAVDDLLGLLPDAAGVWVVEESTAGGTWGAEVATRLYDVAWPLLRRPVGLIHSADSVIPAAPHLERAVLVQAATIHDRIVGGPAAVVAPAVETRAAHGVTVPKLNNNDASYVLVEWLVVAGATVADGEPVALVETSKATEEVLAERAGILRRTLEAGSDCEPGTTIGHLVPADAPHTTVVNGGADGRRVPAVDAPPVPAVPRRGLSAVQSRIADVVTASHREIPAAFTVVRVGMDEALARARRLTDQDGAEVGLVELIVSAVAGLHATYPLLFASLTETGLVDADRPVLGVTVDAGTGLFLPVVRDAHELSVGDLADTLVGLRMKALRGRLRENDLAGMNFLVALNNGPGVVFAQPIIPPGVTCALSVPDVHHEVRIAPDGTPRVRAVADLGLAYDHRVVNGAQAGAFLAALADALRHDATPISRADSADSAAHAARADHDGPGPGRTSPDS